MPNSQLLAKLNSIKIFSYGSACLHSLCTTSRKSISTSLLSKFFQNIICEIQKWLKENCEAVLEKSVQIKLSGLIYITVWCSNKIDEKSMLIYWLIVYTVTFFRKKRSMYDFCRQKCAWDFIESSSKREACSQGCWDWYHHGGRKRPTL